MSGSCLESEPIDDHEVWDLIVADGTWYYTTMNFEDDPDWGVPELWRILPGAEEPEPVSGVQEDSCGRTGPYFGSWHASPEGVAITAVCWDVDRFEVWEYGARPDRV